MPEGRRTIALVDDAADVRALVRARLRLRDDFEVVGEAATGAEALELAAEARPELMLLDVSMPDMDGLDVLERIGRVSPETCVVLFSGFEEHGLADRARQLGAADFIEKSVPIDQVIERLAAVSGGEPPPPRVDGPVDPILEEHLERFRAAFEEAAIGMATLTLAGRVVRANKALLALVGVADLVGSAYTDLVEVDDRAGADAVVATVARGELDVAEVEHELPNGRTVLANVAVVRDTGGTPLYLFVQVQDVTARRQAEVELRRSEERFRLMVSSVRDYAIFMLDPSGRVSSWNLGAERIKGYTADEIIGRHFSTFYPPEAVAVGHPQRELEIAIAEGRYEEEGWRVRKDGTTFWANVVITALHDERGEHVGFAKVTRDMNERKALLEQLERAAEERRQFLAVTAHELRTPVAVVNGFASTLRDHWTDLPEAERIDMVAALARGGERLTRLVEDLLTATRLESGAVDIRPSTFDLHQLLGEVVADLSAADVELSAPPLKVHADRGRVGQMVGNYLTNALRYGQAPVHLSAEKVGDGVVVRVRDSGPGVPDNVVSRLFGKFQRGPSTQEGTGLGLFIVRELARAQGGDAWFEGGSTFALRLPAQRPL